MNLKYKIKKNHKRKQASNKLKWSGNSIYYFLYSYWERIDSWLFGEILFQNETIIK